jgi:O-antigen/teichoic acid export membrane protein
MGITMGTALGFVILFAIFGRWVIRVWATQSAVPSETLMLLMCLWILISTFMNNTATILASRGKTRVLAWLSVTTAALNLALSIVLVQHIGSEGVILGTILSYLALLIVPQTVMAKRVLRDEPRHRHESLSDR